MPKTPSKPKVQREGESRKDTTIGVEPAVNIVAARERTQPSRTKVRYATPSETETRSLRELTAWSGRGDMSDIQPALLSGRRDDADAEVFLAGDPTLLRSACVSIVGTREVSDEGWRRARRLSQELAASDVVIMSGLARGVDTAALSGAIDAGGKVIAVIGTPLDKAYPIENMELQQEIYRRHLLVSPFPMGERVYPSNFPKRNRVMAALSNATVIVEASDTSGTLHQAAACQDLGRWLFILRSVAENPTVTWPRRFLSSPKTAIVDKTSDILDRIGRS